jgi:hypothetical protein
VHNQAYIEANQEFDREYPDEAALVGAEGLYEDMYYYD